MPMPPVPSAPLQRATVATAVALLLAVPASAAAPSWSEWEREHAVAHYGDWMVIRPPGAEPCYAKQSYDEHPAHIEVTVRAGRAPVLIGPYVQGVEGPLRYRVDGGPQRVAPSRGMAAFSLAPDVVPEMRAGAVLVVAVEPRGLPTWRQRISLRGFTAATRAADRCAAESPAALTRASDRDGSRGARSGSRRDLDRSRP